MVSSMDEKIYPSLSLPLSDIPEAKDWKVGEPYTIELTVKMKSIHQDKTGGDVSFEIVKLGVEDEEEEGEEE